LFGAISLRSKGVRWELIAIWRESSRIDEGRPRGGKAPYFARGAGSFLPETDSIKRGTKQDNHSAGRESMISRRWGLRTTAWSY